MAKQTGQQGFRKTGAFQEHELKVCDLCSSLNLEGNTECIVCGWTGHFERSFDVVHTAIIVTTQRHGPLDIGDLTDVRTYCEVQPKLLSRIRSWLSRLWRMMAG